MQIFYIVLTVRLKHKSKVVEVHTVNKYFSPWIQSLILKKKSYMCISKITILHIGNYFIGFWFSC